MVLEIRGIQFAVNRMLGGGSCYGDRTRGRPSLIPHSQWYLDREGKEERFRRQIYSLSVGEVSTGPPTLSLIATPRYDPSGRLGRIRSSPTLSGLQALLEARRRSALIPGERGRRRRQLGASGHLDQRRRLATPPKATAYTRFNLKSELLKYPMRPGPAPPVDGLRIGVVAIIEWPSVNSTLEMSEYRPPFAHDLVSGYLVTSRNGFTFDLSSIYTGKPAIPHGDCEPGATDALTQCAFDHAYVQPASELLTFRGSHWLYYEARPIPHKVRWKMIAYMAVARWPVNRLSSVRADPRCATPGVSPEAPACGEIISRAFVLQGAALRLDARASSGTVRVAVVRAGEAQPLPGLAFADAVPVREDSNRAAAAWTGGGSLGPLVGQEIELHFELCGEAAIFAWMIHESATA
jgi:hypothetical protein